MTFTGWLAIRPCYTLLSVEWQPHCFLWLSFPGGCRQQQGDSSSSRYSWESQQGKRSMTSCSSPQQTDSMLTVSGDLAGAGVQAVHQLGCRCKILIISTRPDGRATGRTPCGFYVALSVSKWQEKQPWKEACREPSWHLPTHYKSDRLKSIIPANKEKEPGGHVGDLKPI